ncbi:hypothetical protein L1987_22277 [Smallanthus sonchifolius]|uniref:Uncharacterized protein n=1 Tax=Smallanthus sonchifolius TaxID=185202 RepID=A0ACB9IG67_9ASTR|nr:hypothetical protein L1987_22277 [Smallanthus sonchifolius]
MRQQDALEFFLYFIDQVERIYVGYLEAGPARSFKFGIEERLQCLSGKKATNKRGAFNKRERREKIDENECGDDTGGAGLL